MLALAVMPVVFVLGELISLGTSCDVTASEKAKSLICLNSSEKCHSDVVLEETREVERGKPLKLATQTLVGAWNAWKRTLHSDWKQ